MWYLKINIKSSSLYLIYENNNNASNSEWYSLIVSHIPTASCPTQTDTDTYPAAVMTTGYFCEFWDVRIVRNIEQEHDGFSFRN